MIEYFWTGLDEDSKEPNKAGLFDFEDDELEQDRATTMPKKSAKSTNTGAEGTVTGDVGTMQASFNMLKVFIGIGILATPASFSQVGIVGGVFGMILVGMISMYTMKL